MSIIWSTLIAVAAYLLKNEVFDPLRGFRAARWSTATVLLAHEDVLANTGMNTPEARAAIRREAAELKAAYMQVPFRSLLARLRFIPSGLEVTAVVGALIGLSNSDRGGDNRDDIRNIRSSLKIA
jgi:hypothetical protein